MDCRAELPSRWFLSEFSQGGSSVGDQRLVGDMMFLFSHFFSSLGGIFWWGYSPPWSQLLLGSSSHMALCLIGFWSYLFLPLPFRFRGEIVSYYFSHISAPGCFTCSFKMFSHLWKNNFFLLKSWTMQGSCHGLNWYIIPF